MSPTLSGTATPALILNTPQTLKVSVTLSDNGPGPEPRHAVLYLLAPEGWQVTPAGAVRVSDLPDTATWQVSVPAGATGGGLTAQAIYDVGPHSSDSIRAQLAASVAYPSLAAAFDNVGITADGDTAPGDIDGSGYSLSAQALAAAGYPPGSAITHAGLTFTWPDVAAGQPDNVSAAGQAILIGGTGSTLGFLVTGTYGPAEGAGTVLYTDGSTQSFTLTAPDWYGSPPSGTDPVIELPYRNTPGNGTDHNEVNVFYAGVALTQGKTVQAVLLPDVAPTLTAGSPALHVFAMALK
jgi:hypothetical protein